MKKGETRKGRFIAPAITAAASVAALIVIAFAVNPPKDNGESSGNNANTTSAVTNTDSAQTETTTTTEEVRTGDNPKNKEEAERIEKEADKRIYLTFDDGPSSNTDDVLDMLKKYDIKATFFDVEKDGETEKKALKRCYDEGHTIAIHTMTHDYDEVYASFENWKKDVLGEQKYIEDITGVKTHYYRFPGGSSNTMARKRGTDIEDCIRWLNSNGFTYYDWNVDNEDSTGKSFTPDQLAANVLDYIGDKGDYMVLCHDTNVKGNTVKSLPKMIETLKNKGFTFCQITDNTEYFQHKKYNQLGD